MATTNFNETGGMEEFLGVLPANHLEPLWSQMGAMVPPTPSPSSKAHIWKYKESLPHLETAAHLVPEEQAERRVLMLVNPGLSTYDLDRLPTQSFNTVSQRLPLPRTLSMAVSRSSTPARLPLLIVTSPLLAVSSSMAMGLPLWRARRCPLPEGM